jgi:hypothetical protein
MNDHQAIVALHWIWAAVFFGLGIFLMLRGGRIASPDRVFCRMRFAEPDAADAEPRIREAVARRQRAEAPKAPLGVWMGIVSIALSAAAAFSSVSVGLLYTILCLAIAGASAQVFLQLRNSNRTRVAVLSIRTPAEVISPYWFVLAAGSACWTLVFIDQPGLKLASVLVCVSAIFTSFIAWRLTTLGAILSGDDLPAEKIVDDRLRFYRSSTALVLAYMQPFVFATQTVEDSPLKWIAAIATFLLFIAYAAWMLRRQRAAVRIA